MYHMSIRGKHLHVVAVQNSLLTAAPPLAAFITGLAAGPAADFVITRRWLSVTITRKLFTFVGKLLSDFSNFFTDNMVLP